MIGGNWRDGAITDEELARVACPTCKQPARQWCVYTPLKTVRQFVTTSSQQALVDRVGTPMKRCHTERYGAARRARYLRWRATQLVEVERPSATSLAILNAGREFDAREREQLKSWLCANARLLIDLARL
jgi:hypothetical protein